MATANEALLDESIRHAVDLQRYSNGVIRRLIAVLNRADRRLMAELVEALERMDPASFTVERLESLLASVRALNTAAYQQIGLELGAELRSLAAYEASYQRQALVSVLPARVRVAAVHVEQVYAAAMSRPFQGVLLRDVWRDLDGKKMRLVRQTIAQGFVEGRTVSDIARQIRGTKARGYADGLLEKSRRDVESVVRAGVSHMAAFVRDRAEDANRDLIKAIKWLSTLDTSTTPECRLRDGRLYTPGEHKPIGHGIPWRSGPGRLHWGCRSVSTQVLKSWRELGLDLDGDPNAEGTRASMDGQVPKDMTYAQWLDRQPASRQDEILGPTRGRLYRQGGLTMDRFYNERGRWLTLDELRVRDEQVFERVGL